MNDHTGDHNTYPNYNNLQLHAFYRGTDALSIYSSFDIYLCNVIKRSTGTMSIYLMLFVLPCGPKR